MAKTAENSTSKRYPLPKWVVLLALAVLVGCIFIPKIDWARLSDWFKAQSFTPDAAISAVEEKLDLTNDGATIFRASAPTLADAETFNAHCAGADTSVVIIGCYTDGVIYLYNIDAEASGLTGIIESTAAHELLHAVWARLDADTRESLTADLESVRAETAELATELELYTEDEQLEELYVRAGTEVANLPDQLETHFARYFRDQDAVAAFYASYHGEFARLQTELETIGARLDELLAEIDDLKAEIELWRQTDPSYANRLVKIANLDIVEYNSLVEAYNANALKTQELYSAINSNIE